jgi:hypothetical protein
MALYRINFVKDWKVLSLVLESDYLVQDILTNQLLAAPSHPSSSLPLTFFFLSLIYVCFFIYNYIYWNCLSKLLLKRHRTVHRTVYRSV